MNYKMKTIAVAAMSVAFAGAAFAQAEVSFYGRANVSVESQKVGSVSETVFVDNSSRFGIRANHNIANGMKVGTTLEAATNLTTGSNNSKLFAREASVYLGGAFGQVKLGKLPGSAAYFATVDYVSNHNHDTGTSTDGLSDYPAAFKLERAISYTSPKISGMTFEAQYGLKNGTASGETVNAANSNSPVSLAATYAIGSLQLGLGHERGDNTFTTANTTDTMNATTLRAYYVMGPVGFGGYVQKTSGTSADRTAVRLSAMYTLGQNEFHVNYGSAGNRAGVANTGADQFTLGYNFNLDKQTKLYALYTQVHNKSAAAYSSDRFFAAPSAGQDVSSYGVGIRYNF